jgi:hypothetical protein
MDLQKLIIYYHQIYTRKVVERKTYLLVSFESCSLYDYPVIKTEDEGECTKKKIILERKKKRREEDRMKLRLLFFALLPSSLSRPSLIFFYFESC